MRVLRAVLALAVVLEPAVAAAQTATGELEERVKILERKLEQAQEDKAAQDKSASPVTAGEKGFGFKSADGSFEFRLRGLLQLDGRFFADDQGAFNDTFLVRRLEPSFEFTLGKLAYFKLQPQFAGDAATTADLFGELRFHPAATLRFGKFKTPLALESLQGSAALMFVERGLPTELGAGRDIGIQLFGEAFAGTTSYAIAYGNGAPDGRDAAASDTDNKKEAAARLFFEPFKNEPGFFRGLGLGVAGTQGTKRQGAANAENVNNFLPRYRSPGQNQIFNYRPALAATAGAPGNTSAYADGTHARLNPQLYFYRGSFGLLGEYVSSEQEVAIGTIAAGPGAATTTRGKFEHNAWQVAASYLLTGEDASFKGVNPNAPYAVGAPGWGAFEVALRHGVLDIDDDVFPTYANPATAVSQAANTGVALNWYMTANARISLDYEDTTFDGGAATGDRADETALLTRVQLAF